MSKLGNAGALVLGGLLLAAPTRRAELDHVGSYNFVVEIEGITAGYFKSVDGLGSEIEVIEYQDGDDLVLRKRPGRVKYGDITLKKGYIASPELFDWYEDIRFGRVERRPMTVRIIPPAGSDEPERRFTTSGSWPKAWKVETGFDGKGNDVVTESIEFVVETVSFR